MPITKDQVGKHKDVPCVRFGTGDILITNGHESGTNFKLLVLAQHTPKPVEDWDNDVPVLDQNGERTTDAHENQVLLYFDNIKSVDNVIHRLEMIKQDLQVSAPGV